MVDDEQRGTWMLRQVHIGEDGIDPFSKSRTQVHRGSLSLPLF